MLFILSTCLEDLLGQGLGGGYYESVRILCSFLDFFGKFQPLFRSSELCELLGLVM